MYKFIRERRPEWAIKEEDIREVEERFGIVFPKVLRDFYLEHNGDYIRTCQFAINEDVYSVQDMHYIKIPKEASVDTILPWRRKDDFFPTNLVPFANDRGGESFYWSTEDSGVYVLDLLEPSIAYRLCDSIEEFFDIMEQAEYI